MASLVFDGRADPITHELVGDVITIGRDPSNNVVIDDPTVSAKHASLTKTPAGYWLRDLGSTNGTQINGAPVSDAKLKDGDEIRFGSVAAIFRDAAKVDQTDGLEASVEHRRPVPAITNAFFPPRLANSRISRKSIFVTLGVLAITAIVIIAWTAAVRYQNKRVESTAQRFNLVTLAKNMRDAVVLISIYDGKGNEIATGSGFFATADGTLVTNYHVIENAGRVVAKSQNGATYAVVGILAANPKADIALLRVEGSNFPFLKFGNSQTAEVGQRIAVVGSPFGLEGTISEGIISGKREFSGGEKWLQITAPISEGSSGSPVVDADGQVIGVAAMLIRESQALNFAVPVEVPEQLSRGVGSNTKPIAFGALPVVREEIFDDKDFLAAVRAYLAGDYAHALSLMKSIRGRFPNSEYFYLLLGQTFEESGFLDDAVSAYQKSIKLKPDFGASWEGLAVAYGKQKRHEEAVAAILQAIKINPNTPSFWDNLGRLYDEQEKFDDAINAFQQAARLDPNDFDSCYGLGRAYSLKNSREAGVEAIRWLQQAVRLEPDHAGAWHFLALNYYGFERYNDAVAAYQQVIRLNPHDHQTWYLLGNAYLNLGRPRDAIAPLEQATLLKPNDCNTWKYLGKAYYDTNQTQEAMDAYRKLKALGCAN